MPARVQSTPELRVVFAGDPLYDMLVMDALRDDAALALLSIVFVFLCAGPSVPFCACPRCPAIKYYKCE